MMTLIVGLNLGAYTFIGDDTRVSYYANDQLCFRDDECNIRCIEIGSMTSAGCSNCSVSLRNGPTPQP
jgi:hypothetical protein